MTPEEKAEYQRQWYVNNKEQHLVNVTKNRARYKSRGEQHVLEYLRKNPCVDCGEDDIEVLQFDHVNPLDDHKAKRVGSYLTASLARLQEEIDKCEVRCANCHVRRTRKQLGWERNI